MDDQSEILVFPVVFVSLSSDKGMTPPVCVMAFRYYVEENANPR